MTLAIKVTPLETRTSIQELARHDIFAVRTLIAKSTFTCADCSENNAPEIFLQIMESSIFMSRKRVLLYGLNLCYCLSKRPHIR